MSAAGPAEERPKEREPLLERIVHAVRIALRVELGNESDRELHLWHAQPRIFGPALARDLRRRTERVRGGCGEGRGCAAHRARLRVR